MVKTKMSKSVPKIAKSAKKVISTLKLEVTPGNMDTNTQTCRLQRIITDAELVPRTLGGWDLAAGLKHLVQADSKFGHIITTHGLPQIYSTVAQGNAAQSPIPNDVTGDHYIALLKIIIYQQLSAKSAEPIFNRFVAAFKLKPGTTLNPTIVRTAKFETTLVDGKRKVLLNGSISGLSESKAKYIVDLTEHFLDSERLHGVDLGTISDEILRAKLIAVKGLGPWSVDMFMLFNLQRPNVLPVGDLVVRRGIARFLGYTEKHFDTTKSQALIPELCRAWSPYCSLATYYMWSTMAPAPSVSSDK